MRVAHVITGLERGGAESMLSALVARTVRDLGGVAVFSLTTAEAYGPGLLASGAEVTALGMRPRPGAALSWARLAAGLRRFAPDVVQTWLYHADLLGGLAARALGHPVVWGVHTTVLAPSRSKAATRAVVRACATLSGTLPARVVFCSEVARRHHAAIGYDDRRALLIDNGVDTARFTPRTGAGERLRAELGLPAGAPLVGMVARYHPDKNHRLFCDAAAVLARRLPSVRFLLCGAGVTADNRELASWLHERGLRDRTVLLGVVAQPEAVIAGLDLATLTSHTEAWPLSLAEAMSCGVPCVATDVGDVRRLLGDGGRVVAPGDAAALADAWQETLAAPPDERRDLGAATRARVLREFSLERAATRYLETWREVAARRGVAGGAGHPGL